MAGQDHFHLLTLPQVASLLRVEGNWPDPITVSVGWFRARARPWNRETPDPMLRLERGGTEFVVAATKRLLEMGSTHVYSPALYPDATRVWRRAGYDTFVRLGIMERSLSKSPESLTAEVAVERDPAWDEILDIDQAAFSGFWRMSRLGLEEAHDSNRRNVLLVTRSAAELTGYAIVGTQWGVTYLHRIAVRPEFRGQRLGTTLVAAAIGWGRKTGGRTIVLNVRHDNSQARAVYARAGFSDTGTDLQVLRYPT